MNILHYSLGFPPYRTGGLTKFCNDLMCQQIREGHRVSLLWPGRMFLFNKNTQIKSHITVNGIQNFEVVNPTPVPYDEGIVDIHLFQTTGNKICYEKLLDDLAPEVIHLHTLMGLHKNFLEAAKERVIRIIFSAHDFFPICPKVTMCRNGQVCAAIENCTDCPECNLTALPIWKIRLLQSGVYRALKDNTIVRKLRKRHRDAYLSEKSVPKTNKSQTVSPSDYMKLRYFYNELLNYVDTVHFNSTLTKQIYEKHLHVNNSVIIPITHSDISDNRKRKHFQNNLRITYLGPEGKAKGYFLLKTALDQIYGKKPFVLNIFFYPSEKPPYATSHNRYSYNQLETIFDNTDVLVAPSILYETFGYTVLEALSFGVPVVISGNVGAKDIISDGTGIVIENLSAKKLAKVFEDLTINKLDKMNLTILKRAYIPTLEDMSQNLHNKVYLQ